MAKSEAKDINFVLLICLSSSSSIPGSKNTEVLVKKSVKNISKSTVMEKIKAADEAKKTPEKKKK